MSRTLTIPPCQSADGLAGRMEVSLALIDAAGLPVPASDPSNTVVVHGLGLIVVEDVAAEVEIATQDELASTTYYRVDVRQGRDMWSRTVQVPAGGALTWAEFLALGAPVDPSDIWSARLLPADATDGDSLVWDDSAGEWVATAVAPGSGLGAGDDAALLGSASATDGYVLTADGAGGAAWEAPTGGAGGGDVSDGATLTTGLTFPAAGLHILDTNASHDLIISPGSNLTADRTLTLTTGDADRTLTLTADAVVGGTNTGDQDLSGLVTKATYDANSILAATADNTPVAVTVAEQTLIGRVTGGAIDDLSASQVRTLLELGTSATTPATDYAPAAKGVTNGDSHDHNGGDGGPIAYSSLSGAPNLGGAALLNVGATTGTVAAGDDARLSDARTPTSHVHGNLSNAGAIGTTANLPVITGASGVLAAGAFGTGATDFCAGNDSRLSNSRTPSYHASSHATGQGDAIAPSAIGAQSALPAPLVVEFTAGSGTYSVPAGYRKFTLWMAGAGSGGASGGRRDSGTAHSGGGGGAGGGTLLIENWPISYLGSSVAWSVGAGTTGGVGVSAVGNGTNGMTANPTRFGDFSVFGGYLSTAGTTGAAAGGPTVGQSIQGNASGAGGAGASGAAGAIGGNATGLAGGGGGAGGGISTTPTAYAGGVGGFSGSQMYRDSDGTATILGGTAGSVGAAGGNGDPGADISIYFAAGAGGGGGGGSTTGDGGAGGNGGYPGGAGGGGGATMIGTSGAGGNGADGKIVLILT